MNSDENQLLRAKQFALVPTNTALAAEFVKEVRQWPDSLKQWPVPAPGPELGAKWPDAAKTIYAVSSAGSPASLPRMSDWTNWR
jgi:hypothetical protein